MKLAILDRDGTLNPLGDEYITSPEEWTPVPGALEAIARLNHAGWHVVVATNQPGLGRGLFDVVALNAIHAKMHRQLAAMGGRIDAVFYCPHAADEECSCRKPAPGLLEQICDRYGAERSEVQVVGSCAAHLQAGSALGAQLHLVCTAARPMWMLWPPRCPPGCRPVPACTPAWAILQATFCQPRLAPGPRCRPDGPAVGLLFIS